MVTTRGSSEIHVGGLEVFGEYIGEDSELILFLFAVNFAGHETMIKMQGN